MIITREIINKNIKFHDVQFYPNDKIEQINCDYNDLSNAIDLYKKLLIDSGVLPQQTVTIAETNSIWQIAALFACFELGIKVAITDYFANSILTKLDFKNVELDTKTKALLPIDYGLLPDVKSYSANESKIYYVKLISKFSIERNFSFEDLKNKIVVDIPKNFTTTDNYIVTKSATSGTTGAPKCIEHSHGFLYELLIRNSNLFSGNFVLRNNLNHGSSIFCYCVPALASTKVTDYFMLKYGTTHDEKNQLHTQKPNTLRTDTTNDNRLTTKFLNNLKNETHIMMPYPDFTDDIIRHASDYPIPNVILHVLSYIKTEWVENGYKKNIVGDIISNFGSNETTGPIFINKASNKNFSECKYSIFDNFFDIKIKNTRVEIDMPVYDKVVEMNDVFLIAEDGNYLHKGRSNLIRINDLEVNMNLYNSKLEDFFHATLVIDNVKSKIYLAIWNHVSLNTNEVDKNLKTINQIYKELSFDKHYICKYTILNYDEYLGAIKLDMEKLREYFRNPDGDYKTID